MHSENKVELLRQVFPDMEEADLTKLAGVASLRTHPPDTILCHEGQVENTFYAIASGQVEVVKRLDKETQEVINRPENFPDCATCSLTADDSMLFYKYRVANLKKLYPYIPEKLNRVLMNFSIGTYIFYEKYDDLIEDLGEAIEDLN